MAMLGEGLARAEQLTKNLSHGQTDLFQHDDSLPVQSTNLAGILPWTMEEKLQGEKESLGMYISGHPLESVEGELKKLNVTKYRNITAAKKDQKVFVGGLVISVRTLLTKNGDRMAVLMLDDRFDRFEVTVFPDPYQKYRDLLIKDQLLIIEGLAGIDNFSGNLRIKTQSVYTLALARENFAKKIKIRLQSAELKEGFVDALKDCLMFQERGNCSVYIEYHNELANARIKLDEKWNIKASDTSLNKINQMLQNAVEVEY